MVQRVILLHGPPACGKLTTARALATRHDGIILHNHLTFNLAQTLFEIGDQRLLNLHRELRLVMLRHALGEPPMGASPLPDLILTLVYAEPDSVANVAEIVSLVTDAGARLLPVYLKCAEDTLMERVMEESRAREGKLDSATRLRALLDTHDYPPMPHPGTRIIENDARTAESVAEEIVRLLT